MKCSKNLRVKVGSSTERLSVMILHCKFKSRIQGIRQALNVPAGKKNPTKDTKHNAAFRDMKDHDGIYSMLD